MINKKHYKRMTPASFKMLKSLVDAGINISKISVATGRSYNVVRHVIKSKTFDDYVFLVRETYAKYSKPKNGNGEAKEIPLPIPPPEAFTGKSSSAKTIIELLSEINNNILVLKQKTEMLEIATRQGIIWK